MPQLRPSQIVVMASGAGLFVFSFVTLIKGQGNSWHDFGSQSLPPLYGLAALAVYAATAFTEFKPPERILTFRISQLLLILAVAALLTYIGVWRVTSNLDVGLGAGFWLMFLSAIGLTAGAVMEIQSGTDSAGQPGSTPPTPF